MKPAKQKPRRHAKQKIRKSLISSLAIKGCEGGGGFHNYVFSFSTTPHQLSS